MPIADPGTHYATQLQQLRDMGFVDEARNIQVGREERREERREGGEGGEGGRKRLESFIMLILFISFY
jgi:hypothetical protein